MDDDDENPRLFFLHSSFPMEAAHAFSWKRKIITCATWAACDYLSTVVLWYLPRVAYKPPILTTQPFVGSPSLKFTADWHPANRCGWKETNLGNVVGAIYLFQGMFKKTGEFFGLFNAPPLLTGGSDMRHGACWNKSLVRSNHRSGSLLPGDAGSPWTLPTMCFFFQFLWMVCFYG